MTSQVSFNVVTTNVDGSPLTETVTYELFIDTVNPPVKVYPVPAAIAAAPVAGVITVPFSAIGFVGTPKTTYYIDAVATDADGNSPPSTPISFVYATTPAAVTGLKVS